MVGMAATWALAVWLGPVSGVAQEPHGPVAPAGVPPDDLFQTLSDCLACHNGLTTPAGEDVSIGVQWRASMMANSSRDPYWHAAVRRETIDHPEHAAAIEDECSICHMPMARTRAGARGPGVRQPEVERRWRHARGATGGRRCLVHGLPPDQRRAAGHAGEFWRRLRHGRARGRRVAIHRRALRGQRRPHRADAVGDGRAADRGGPHSPVGVVRDVPHADDRSV